MSGLFAAGLILLALAATADFLGGRFLRSWPLYLAGAAGSACLAVLGGFALTGRDVQLDVAGWLGDPIPGQQAAALAALTTCGAPRRSRSGPGSDRSSPRHRRLAAAALAGTVSAAAMDVTYALPGADAYAVRAAHR